MKQAPDLFNGIPILFTREESHRLRNVFLHLRKVTNEEAMGWQLEVISRMHDVNRIIHTCIARGRRTPDPRQMGLPLS